MQAPRTHRPCKPPKHHSASSPSMLAMCRTAKKICVGPKNRIHVTMVCGFRAKTCCAGWCRAAGETRVGGPHGRGTLLRPCAPCNPARLMTQILGAVQPRSRGSVPCAGPLLTATGEAGIRRSRFLPLLHCPIKNRFVPSIETKLPNLSIRPPVAFVCLPIGPLILLP